MQTLTVKLNERSYPIYIGQGLLHQPALLRQLIRGQQACVVTNTTLAPLYLATVRQSLQGLHYSEVILPDGERYKNVDALTPIYDRLLTDKHHRSTTLIALGGGVIGDITGFAAATYQRGVDFIQLPTTLLAQVDSSIGGKTGINHPLGKNMIGAFHQPRAVIADTDTLNTLPDRERAAGFAEVIKYGLIRDKDFYGWLHKHCAKGLALDDQALSHMILRCCENKAAIVAADEYEAGIRAILNLGHTFGHAIETLQGYGKYLHGEAVAIGVVLAAQLSANLGYISNADVDALKNLLQQLQLPIKPPTMSCADYLAAMAVDKKAVDGRLRFVLLKQIGEAFISDDVSPTMLQDVLQQAGIAD